MNQQHVIYEDAKDTAKKIRKALKEAFPTSKFSVKSNTYSMGSSVYVTWTGGDEPDHEKASAGCDGFASTKFDNMTDYADLVGYTYEGQVYYGADYVIYMRR